MIELRNGKLKIDSKRSALEILLDISIVAMLTVLLRLISASESEIIYITLLLFPLPV